MLESGNAARIVPAAASMGSDGGLRSFVAPHAEVAAPLRRAAKASRRGRRSRTPAAPPGVRSRGWSIKSWRSMHRLGGPGAGPCLDQVKTLTGKRISRQSDRQRAEEQQ